MTHPRTFHLHPATLYAILILTLALVLPMADPTCSAATERTPAYVTPPIATRP